GGVSYTIDTLEAIGSAHPDAELFLLLGADSLIDLPKWHRPADICQLATPLVVHRAESPEPNFAVLSQLMSSERSDQIRDQIVEMPPTPISSSKIRALIGSGGEWQSLVPAEVADYIVESRLYAVDR
ncbi:MAG: nicotinate-nicotinamide nucleotide adenylyltransferase, partial [Bythopirellula sp.]